jgi:hypothetical protein
MPNNKTQKRARKIRRLTRTKKGGSNCFTYDDQLEQFEYNKKYLAIPKGPDNNISTNKNLKGFEAWYAGEYIGRGPVKYLRFRLDAPEDEDVIKRKKNGESLVSSSNPNSKYKNLQVSSMTGSLFFKMNKTMPAAQYTFCLLE